MFRTISSGAKSPAVPGPRGYPLVGVLPQAWRDPLSFFVNISRRYGDIVHFKMGPEDVYLLNHPDFIKHVLSENHTNYQKSKFTQILRPILGDGIFLSEHHVWREQRRVTMPAFKAAALRKLAPAMTDATADALTRWQTLYGDGQVFNGAQEIMRLTLDIVFRTILNVELGDRSDMVFASLSTVLKTLEARVWRLTRLGEKLPTAENRAFNQAIANLDAVVYSVIDARRPNPHAADDLLALLLDAYGGPGEASRKMLRDQVLSVMLAGHETTANALTWMFYLLHKHPDAKAKLLSEVETALGGRVPDADDLPKLEYTRQVFMETTRLYPPVWTMSRDALSDDEIGGYKIQRGKTVMLSPFVVHRNEALWPDPEKFDPERFTQSNSEDRHYFAHFPFGGGPRGCLGKYFALMEGQLILPMILQNFDLVVEEGYVADPEPMVALRPRHGLPVRLAAKHQHRRVAA